MSAPAAPAGGGAESDWTGRSGIDTAARYRLMAERQVRGISPSYERLGRGVASDDVLLARLDELPPPKRQPNLLFGAVRFLGGPVASYEDFRAWVLANWDQLSSTMLARSTQTNEPGRCATLLPVLAALPQPLALLEVGSSAGLCLYPDRYAYRYAAAHGERVVGASPVELHCTVSGAVPLPARPPRVVWRAGLDLNPLDVRDDQDMRWLESLIWPEQSERFAILRGAVEIARADPPHLVTGDLVLDLPGIAAQAPRDATLVVFHTAVLAYVDLAGRQAFAETVSELDACWLSNEAPGVVPGTSVDTGATSRFVLARDGEPVALPGPHGGSIDWLTH
jgi:hypothetical protein